METGGLIITIKLRWRFSSDIPSVAVTERSGEYSTDTGPGQMEIAELMAALLPSWMGEGENHAIKTLTQPLSASILLLLINLHLYPLNMI